MLQTSLSSDCPDEVTDDVLRSTRADFWHSVTKPRDRRRQGFLLLIVFAVFVFSASAQTAPANQPSQALSDRSLTNKEAIVQLVAVDPDGNEFKATGFFLNSGNVIATVGYVATSSRELHVAGSDERLRLLYVSENGVAFLHSDRPNPHFLAVANHDPQVGERIAAIGYSQDNQRLTDPGSVKAVPGPDRFVYTRGATQRAGFAGAPIVDEEGDVLGVHWTQGFESNTGAGINLRSEVPILQKLGLLPPVSSKALQSKSVQLNCDDDVTSSAEFEFELAEDERIADARASIENRNATKWATVKITSILKNKVAVEYQVAAVSKTLRILCRAQSKHVPILVEVFIEKRAVQ
jgi:hypothetical protein